MCVVNTHVTSYQSKTNEKFLETSEKDKKKIYLNACLKQLCYFTPFVASVYGLLGVKTETNIKRIFGRLAKKLEGTLITYLRVCEE